MDEKKQYALLLALHKWGGESTETLQKALDYLGINNAALEPNPGPEIKKLIQTLADDTKKLKDELYKLTFFDEEVRFLLSVSVNLAIEYLETVLKKR